MYLNNQKDHGLPDHISNRYLYSSLPEKLFQCLTRHAFLLINSYISKHETYLASVVDLFTYKKIYVNESESSIIKHRKAKQ